MLMFTSNAVICAVYYGAMFAQITTPNFYTHYSHAVPFALTFIDFCVNRILFEVNQWWIPTVWFAIYAFVILWPVTEFYRDIYQWLNFKTLEGGLTLGALLCIVPVTYYIIFGLSLLK